MSTKSCRAVSEMLDSRWQRGLGLVRLSFSSSAQVGWGASQRRQQGVAVLRCCRSTIRAVTTATR